MSAADLMGLAGAPPPGAPQSIQIPGGPPGPGGPPPPGGPDPGMGAPPGPPGAEGGLPPELMALLGGEEPGGPEGPGGPEEEVDAERGELEILDSIRSELLEYMDVASDDIEKSKAAQALKIVQDLFAGNQKNTEAASGTTPAMKGMARAIGG